jgi:hypothetical protein
MEDLSGFHGASPAASGIAWPSGPFALEPSRTSPAAPWIVCACGLVLVGLGVWLLVFTTTEPKFRQALADAAASFGFGTPIAGAAIGDVRCSPWRRNPASAIQFHRCELRLVGTPSPVTMEIDVQRPVAAREATRIARIDGRTAIAWPRDFALGRLRAMAGVGLAALALVAGGAAFFALAARLALPARLAREGRIVEVDLLRRQVQRRGGATWDFAYDWRGRRHYGRVRIYRDPLILDGIVTRGAVLAMGAGRHMLLLRHLAPLHLAASETARLDAAVSAQFHAERPLIAPALRLPDVSGAAAQAFLQAEVDAWNARDADAANAAIERRHAAAWRTSRRRVDAVLQGMRAVLPAARPWRD